MSPNEIAVLQTKMREVIELNMAFSAQLKELTGMITNLPPASSNPEEFLEVAMKIERLKKTLA